MSKIQDALQKLQKDQVTPAKEPAALPDGGAEKQADSVIPIARKHKVVVEGAKHFLDPAELVRAGLLAPPGHEIPITDQFRRIKRPLLENVARNRGPDSHVMNLILVSSATPGAGKTFCCVNLAISISLERELNVLLVDADVAKPHISRALDLEDRLGLIDVLENESRSVEEVLVRTNLNDIQVLPAGRKHVQSTELLASDRMTDLMAELAGRYPDRIIIIDSPPLLITSEAQALARQAGQIVLVIESAKTSQSEIEEVLDSLDRSKPINAILNKSRHSQGHGYYGRGYGNHGFDDDAV